MASTHSEAARILGERIRGVRLGLGMSQEEIAQLADIHVTNLGKIERGQANPSLTTIVRVSGVLGTDPAELVRGLGLEDLPDTTRPLTVADFVRERRSRGL
ncbi:MAG TPA: helix-turn-helix transcriptional regulator [Microterricola sp.]